MRRDQTAYVLDMLIAAREAVGQAHPAIPWRDIVGMRNRLVHGYFDIDLRLVWDTVGTDLPVLIDQLERLLPKDAG